MRYINKIHLISDKTKDCHYKIMSNGSLRGSKIPPQIKINAVPHNSGNALVVNCYCKDQSKIDKAIKKLREKYHLIVIVNYVK